MKISQIAYEKNVITVTSLRNYEKYLNQRIIDTYFELLEVIEFDKILAALEYVSADVSNQEINESSNEFFSRWKGDEFFSKLTIGSARNRSTIDRAALTDTFANCLNDEFENKSIFLNSLESRELFYYYEGEIKLLQNFRISTFKRFLHSIFRDHIRQKEIDLIDSVLSNRVNEDSDNYIIQFLDCYICNAKLFEGVSRKGFKWFIKKRIYEDVSKGSVGKVVPEVDQLINHLVNFDLSTKDRFLDVSSSVFLNDVNYKASYGGAIRLYNSTGENGKSLFLNLFKRSIGEENMTAFRVQDLSNERTIYSVANSLLAIDFDSPNARISSIAAGIFKNVVTSDGVVVRQLYREQRTIQPVSLIVVASNDLPSSEDKSGGYDRRWNLIETEKRLKESYPDLTQDWFDRIRSEEASDYFCKTLIVRALDLKNRELSPKSEHMIRNDERYSSSNNSAKEFFESFTVYNIVGRSVREIREEYEEFCLMNDLPVLKRQFKDIMRSFELIDTSIRIGKTAEGSQAQMYLSSKSSSSVIKAWQHQDPEENQRILQAIKDGSYLQELEEN